MVDEGRANPLDTHLPPISFGEGVNDWARWDLPMLWAIHHTLDEDPERPHHVRLSQLVPLLGIHENDLPWIYRAVERLVTAGYIRSPPLQGGGHRRQYEFVTEVTPEALRILGVWPNEQTAIDALVAALNDGARQVAPKDPEAASRLREVASWFLAGGREIAVGVGTSLIKQLTGLP